MLSIRWAKRGTVKNGTVTMATNFFITSKVEILDEKVVKKKTVPDCERRGQFEEGN